MNKMHILILILFISLTLSERYVSDYYNNVTNILNKYPKIDIDYIFYKPNKESKKESNEPSSDIFQNIFYDYYQTSVPLYSDKMKCYFPIKKNISLKLDTEYENATKTKNISKFLGKYFIKSLKGKCEQYYVERWYYTLCPLIGAMQTLSYLKSEDNKKEDEKPEVNYLGYEIDFDYDNNTIFLENIDEKTKKYLEQKYSDDIEDIYENNLYNNKAENSKIIGIHNNVVKFYGENVYDGSRFNNYKKIFKLEYKTSFSDEKKIFTADIIKTINNNLILINQTLSMDKLLYINKVNKIKILKKDLIAKNDYLYHFFNQSSFIYDEYLYSSKISLGLCVNKNCMITISNDDSVYKIDTIVDQKFALLEKGLNKDIKKYENAKEYYCLFYDDDRLYFFGKGEIEELTETEEAYTLILYGKDLDIENTEEIMILLNNTFSDYDNMLFINSIFSKYIRLKYESKINETHYIVKMLNKNDILLFEKQISLDEKYIIVKNNTNKKKDNHKKEEQKYAILGNEKNISLDKPIVIEKDILQIKNSSDKLSFYKVENNKEFFFTFEISSYYTNIRESYSSFIFSNNKKIKQGDYELLIDKKNNAIIIRQLKDQKNNEEPLAFTINNNKIGSSIKYGVAFINYTFYVNSYFNDEKNKEESEIILKYKINNDNEKYDINYMIINQLNSTNIIIDDIKFIDSIPFDIFKNIYIYNQKYLLDDNTVYIDTFEKGDYCEPIKANRKVIINYSCDEEGIYDFKLTKVHEDKKSICVYNYYAKSRFLCNPNYMMKNYLKKSGTKTSCYLDS